MTASIAPLRLAFYGDDFTGSTDALEVLAFAGLRCALFLEVPSARTLQEFGPFDAIGVAGASRSMSPAEMDAQLPAVLSALAALPVPLVHYKVCSTFDSSSAVGSIGRVMDLARVAFDTAASPATIPIIAATPALGRYCIFGNLYARSATDGRVHRLDRHPIMSTHPVTPMTEADLVMHLGSQTARQIARFDLPVFAQPLQARDAELDRLTEDGTHAILFDGAEPAHLTEAGRQLERLCANRTHPLFAVGSSGLEYALTQWWAQSGAINASVAGQFDRFAAVDQVLAISGSASALSAQQIEAALTAGFIDMAVDASALVAAADWQQQLEALALRTITALRAGHSVMMHTARGNRDGRIKALLQTLVASGVEPRHAQHHGGRLLGQRLGLLADQVLRAVPLPRLVLSGGDTASLITQQLAPEALQVAARLAPGAPLCRVLSQAPHLASLQIALKGGQMGSPDYFVKALRGSDLIARSPVPPIPILNLAVQVRSVTPLTSSQCFWIPLQQAGWHLVSTMT